MGQEVLCNRQLLRAPADAGPGPGPVSSPGYLALPLPLPAQPLLHSFLEAGQMPTLRLATQDPRTPVCWGRGSGWLDRSSPGHAGWRRC